VYLAPLSAALLRAGPLNAQMIVIEFQLVRVRVKFRG